MRAGIGDGLLEGARELFRRVDTARRDAEPGAELDEIEVWIPQVELCLGSGTASGTPMRASSASRIA